ncbi:TM2 domain-containing protein 1-like [Acropora palmata]|uniref:TM2 domain-containing protein 1-like n=1 Tax=Acropora palmata TaxID=6131 RepID=UPI003DA12138
MFFRWKNYLFSCLLSIFCTWIILETKGETSKCDNLLLGQYFCPDPDIDASTQAAVGCTVNHTVEVKCQAAAVGKDGENITACIKNVSCQYTNGHSYETALLLSVFLGMFGIDRFYLGYPAIGLLKFCTLGFFFVFHLVDIVLIATQVVGPADGSSYIIDYYGPRLTHISKNMFTYYKPED